MYRSVRLASVLDGVIRKRGFDPASVTLSAGDKANVADLVSLKLREAWENEWWPDSMAVEQRQYRPTWSAAESYAADAEVMRLDDEEVAHYFRSVQGGNLNHDPNDDDGTWWEDADADLERSIALEQEWEENGIGRIDTQNGVFDRDPRIYPEAMPIDHVFLHGDAVIVGADQAPARPWLKFQLACPVASWTDWAAGTAYAAGDVVFVEEHAGTVIGEAFVAVAPSTGVNPAADDGTYWQQQYFPAFLRDFVVHAVAAEEVLEDEARYRMTALAQRIYENLKERLVSAQGRRGRVVVRVGR